MSVKSRPVCTIVNIRARPETLEEAMRELAAMVGPTRANPECLELRVCQGRDDPTEFAIWERWTSVEAGVANLERPYMKAYLARAAELFESSEWSSFDEIDYGDGS
jgi:quinol monooxygenase YgiN